MAKRANEFQSIRSEGGLLPPDLLRRVIDPRGTLQGTKPQDYGLPAGERLNEVITQSWNRLRRHWLEFRAAAERLPESEAGTGLTNDKWSLPLLRELGFGLVPASSGPEVAGRTYAISRLFGAVPIHLIGCGLNLDRRAAGVRGAAASNPHGLVQEFLNRSADHLWGIVSNGLQLRVLRDNQALSRQSFLEFDLEAMFDAEIYSDFVLLWLVGHATRFTPQDGVRCETCWLEEWTKEAQEQGTRALKSLRGSVERALQVLGEGFTSHPKNVALRDALRSGSLVLTDFHGQLLRIVYRLIFLLVAEDRILEGQSLLHPRDNAEVARVARERYASYYGSARLRDLAGKIKGSRHDDLWHQFQTLVCALSGDGAFEDTRRRLALPALGSLLWSPHSTATLNSSGLTNYDFLEAIRHLAYARQDKVLRPIDYKNLGAEELGGVYEGLLALTPQISADGAHFTFEEFAGNERKTSGSYYTTDSLVQCLLDSALDPVVEAAVESKSGAEAEQSILALKVCDPAVGSGHFLVGAAHRLARHLARVRAQAQGESEPSPLLYQQALRDVIGRCLYGVDVNPMAAELCRVSLWLEALEPDKPLSFLDHHIRVGNSLLGTTSALIARGLPDEAFNPNESDDKKTCSALKKRNRLEREGGQLDFGMQMVAEPREDYDTLVARSQSIDRAADDSIEAIARKAELFQRLIGSPEYQHRQQVADAWCAAFVWQKSASTNVAAAEPLTTDTIRRLAANPDVLSTAQRKEMEQLAVRYRFFHWHLAFPEVFAQGGFDCLLGNPPWVRQELFRPLKNLLATYSSFSSTADLSVSFVELAIRILGGTGTCALLTPNKWFRAAYGESLRLYLRTSSRIRLVIDFGHSKTLFPDADTFPACIVLQPASSTVAGDVQFSFVRAFDGDLASSSLSKLVAERAVLVSHSRLNASGWSFSDERAESILQRMRDSGVVLAQAVGSAPLYGVKTGLNEAFYLSDQQAQCMLIENPQSQAVLRPFVRGRDVSRWMVEWERVWHIVVPSSQNRSWPWSMAPTEEEAEQVFAGTFPVVHAHLKQFENGLRQRTDQGKYWWELRSCDYYEQFTKPKIVVSRIAFHSACGLDTVGYFQNDSTVIIPTTDLYVLAVLNSRVVWWYMTLTFPHKKDEALSMDAEFLARLPLPRVSDSAKEQIRHCCRALVEAARDKVQPADSQIDLERQISSMVWSAYGFSPVEEQILDDFEVLRDPLRVMERAAASLRDHPA